MRKLIFMKKYKQKVLFVNYRSFLVFDQIAIETKATKQINPRDLKNLQILKEENIFKKFFLISQDPIEKKFDDISCIHWKTFMEKLWTDEIVEK